MDAFYDISDCIHLFRSRARVFMLYKLSPTHSEMSSLHILFGLPLHRLPSILPSNVAFTGRLLLFMCLIHRSFGLLMFNEIGWIPNFARSSVIGILSLSRCPVIHLITWLWKISIIWRRWAVQIIVSQAKSATGDVWFVEESLSTYRDSFVF